MIHPFLGTRQRRRLEIHALDVLLSHSCDLNHGGAGEGPGGGALHARPFRISRRAGGGGGTDWGGLGSRVPIGSDAARTRWPAAWRRPELG